MKTGSLLLLLSLCLAQSCTQALPRDKTQVARFKKSHPCPASPCKGYQVDHKKSLMTGGADHPDNMQWVKTEDHKKKTKQDLAECKAGPVCLHRRLKKSG